MLLDDPVKLAMSEEAPREGQRTLPPKQPDIEFGVVRERRRAEEVSAYDAQVLMKLPRRKKHRGRGSERSH